MARDLLPARLPAVLLPWHWDFANNILYKLCKQHPRHSDPDVTIAKVWLIGRAYAAAIERTKGPHRGSPEFYARRVAKQVCGSKLDTWLEALHRFRRLDAVALNQVISTHGKVTKLFSRISGENKRSLASKYLHFHAPNLFYLYDTRAVKGLRRLSAVVGRVTHDRAVGDKQYMVFAEKCFRLQQHIHTHYNVRLTPRQLDRLLLRIADAPGT